MFNFQSLLTPTEKSGLPFGYAKERDYRICHSPDTNVLQRTLNHFTESGSLYNGCMKKTQQNTEKSTTRFFSQMLRLTIKTSTVDFCLIAFLLNVANCQMCIDRKN